MGMTSVVSRAVVVLISVVMVMSAVPMLVPSTSPVGEAAAQTGGYVHVGWMQKFQNWNPLNIELVSDWVATFLVYSSLFQYDEAFEGIENNLATGYYQQTHGTGNMSTWINITDSAYFRNKVAPTDTSHQLTAVDVKYTIELIQGNPGGVWDYYVANITGVYVINPYQVKIDTEYPKATLIDDLVWVPIVPKYWWENPLNVDPDKVLANLSPFDLIGSGPFYFEDQKLNQWYQFTTAPNYHCTADYGEARDIDFEGIIYTIYSNPSGLKLAIESGAEDVIDASGIPPQTWDSLGVGYPNIVKQVTNELGIYDICINAIPEEFRTKSYCNGNLILLDKVVRKAIGMTLNRQSLIDNYFGGRPIAADTVLNPGPWHADLASYTDVLPYDPAAARTMLEAAGYIDGPDADSILEVTATSAAYTEHGVAIGTPLEFRLRVPDSDDAYGTIGEAWVDWARQAGIQFNFEEVSEGIMISFDWYKAYFDVWVWSWYWGPEPLSNLAVWRTAEVKEGGDNCAGPIVDDWYWVDEEEKIARCSFDDVLEEAMRTVDVNERKALVDELQVMIYDSYTEFPPIHPNGLYAMSTADYVGWGDWTNNLARTIISDMLWVWYDLEPTSANLNPEFNTPLGDSEWEVNLPASFTVGVSDEDGDDIMMNWNWGDGTDNTTQTISGVDTTIEQMVTQTHTYTVKGEYTIVVSIRDDQHTSWNADIATVNVVGDTNLGPEIGTVAADPAMAYVGEQVTWTAEARDAEQGVTGEGLLFTWDWGDGSPCTIQLVKPVANDTYIANTQTHTWTYDDTFDVTVSVWDGFEDEENVFHNVSVTKSYDVIENSPPDVMVSSISGIEGVEVYCVATAADPDPDVLTITWEWDDGTYSVTTHDTSGAKGVPVTSVVSHTWSTQGTYPVTVYVDDGEGTGHNVSTSIDADIMGASDDAPPGSIALVVTPYPPYVNEEITLNVSAYDANGDVLTVTIEFGDDDIAVEMTAGGTTNLQYVEFTHTYTAANTYMVTVHVDDGTTNVTTDPPFTLVISLPTANRAPVLTLSTAYSFYLGVEKQIKPSEVYDPDDDPLSVWYDWGDESPLTKGDDSAGYAASHTYLTAGDYTLSVYADDGQGHNTTKTASLNVQEDNRRPSVGPILKTPLKESYELDENITFSFVVADKEGDDVQVFIDFGDGTNQTLNITDLQPATNRSLSFVHAYGEEGEYSVKVVVKDDYLHAYDWLSSETKVEVKAEKAGDLSTAAIIGIVVAVVIVVALAVLLLMRKKKGKAEEGGMEGMVSPEATEPGPPPPP